MNWDLRYLPEAEDDLDQLDNGVRKIVLKAIGKVKKNPLPKNEGGYGEPLGRKQAIDLSGYLKIKIRNAGIRVIYRLERIENQMVIVVVGARRDNIVYNTANQRLNADK